MDKKSPSYILIFIVLISFVFGLAISSVHYLTLPMLEKNEALHKNRIISQAFMLDVEKDTPEAYEDAIRQFIKIDSIEIKREKVEFFRHREKDYIGFIFKGLGFWEPISGIIVMDRDLEKIINLKILEQKETPGLGARIEEPWFTEQFQQLAIKWNDNQKIIIGATSNPDKSNVVETITGASQTSDALMNMLNENLAEFKKNYKDK
ncbi:MAG: FMN-binding protein [Candidatus Marinimicrobia bacterium]|nr:FMN-binding protein [Candidatus Neomarinimicrobiota bacterium]